MSLKSYSQVKLADKTQIFRKSRKQAILKKLRFKDKKFECCICYDINVRFEELTHCGHAICEDCMNGLPKPICPMCREEIELTERAQKNLDDQRNSKLMTYRYIRLFRKIDPMSCVYIMDSFEISEDVDDDEDF